MIAALVMFVVEILTSGFAAICLTFGALAGAVAAAAGCSLKLQILWFAIFTLASFVLVRPLMIKMFARRGQGRKSGVEALVGRDAIVTETIDPVSGRGRVAVDGDSWKAQPDDGSVIGCGEHVTVVRVNSVILTVSRK